MAAPYILLSNSLKVDAAKPLDYLYGPWANVSEALSKIASSRRFIGLTCAVLVEGHAVEYWFKNGVNDSDLIVKQTGGGGGSGLNSTEVVSIAEETTTYLEQNFGSQGFNLVIVTSTEKAYFRYDENKWLSVAIGILGPSPSPVANIAGVNYLSMV